MPKQSSNAGVYAMIVLMALITAWGMRTALHRTVRLDDPNRVHSASLPDMRINVNHASAAELSILPGLGPALAQRVVNDRERNGQFNALEDMMRVAGIGPAIVERIRPHAVVE